ncbi:MAG: hypothetical protein ABI592_01640 [Acidobacteriota bacterium]
MRNRIGLAALFALLVIACHADPIFFRRIYAGRDLTVYNLPMERAVHDAWSRGKIPVWSPGISGGRPLAPNPNAGALYPVRILLAPLPFPAAMRLFPVIHWLGAGIGMLLLLSALGASAAAGWIAAVAYVFSGVGVGMVFFPNLHPGTALIPWIVGVFARPGLSVGRRAIGLGGLFGLAGLAGDPFGAGMALFACGVFLVLAGRGEQRVAALLLGLLLGGLLAAPQLAATLLWAPETARGITGLTLGDALLFSLSPWRLLELAIPYPFGATAALSRWETWGWPVFHYKTLGFHATLFAGSLSVVALPLLWRDRGIPVRFARWTLALSLLLAIPGSLLPKAWSGSASPIPLRNPEKFTVLTVFALAVLAGLAWDGLRRIAVRPRWPLAAAALCAALAVGVALVGRPAGALAVAAVGTDPALARLADAPPDLAAVAARRIPAALAEAGLLWIATGIAIDLLARRSRRPAPAAAALLLFTAVPIAATLRIPFSLPEANVLAPTAYARHVARLDPAGRFRVLGESLFRPLSPVWKANDEADQAGVDDGRRGWYQQTHQLWGRGTVLQYDFDEGDLSRLVSLRRIAGGASQEAWGEGLFGSLGLRFGVRYRDQEALPGYRRTGGDALQDWDELPGALPAIRLAGSWRETPGPVEAFRTLPALAGGEVVVESGRDARGTAGERSLRVLSDRPEKLVLDAGGPRPGWLFVLRGFWTHRRVRVDGREVGPVPAQLAYSALALPAGVHRVEWEERLPGWPESGLGPGLYGAIGLFVVARGKREKR